MSEDIMAYVKRINDAEKAKWGVTNEDIARQVAGISSPKMMLPDELRTFAAGSNPGNQLSQFSSPPPLGLPGNWNQFSIVNAPPNSIIGFEPSGKSIIAPWAYGFDSKFGWIRITMDSAGKFLAYQPGADVAIPLTGTDQARIKNSFQPTAKYQTDFILLMQRASFCSCGGGGGGGGGQVTPPASGGGLPTPLPGPGIGDPIITPIAGGGIVLPVVGGGQDPGPQVVPKTCHLEILTIAVWGRIVFSEPRCVGHCSNNNHDCNMVKVSNERTRTTTIYCGCSVNGEGAAGEPTTCHGKISVNAKGESRIHCPGSCVEGRECKESRLTHSPPDDPSIEIIRSFCGCRRKVEDA